MTLERLTQITSVGITSGITLSSATLTGVTTLTTLSAGGDIDAVNGTFSGDLNVAGTLTYEDVSNIDSVGVVTARSGLNVTGGDVGIGTDSAGTDLHLVTYGGHGKIRVESSGDGNRAGIEFFRESSAGTGKGAAGIWVESETGNSTGELRFGTANNASLQSFNTKMIMDVNGRLGIGTESPADSLLQVIGDVRLGNSIGDSGRQLIFNANRESASDTIANLNFEWNSTTVAQIRAQAGSDTTNKDDGHLLFFTAPEGAIQERLRITSAGDVGINATPSQNDMPGVKPRLHVVGISSNTQFNTVARFEAGGDSDNTGSAIVLNHSNDRGIVIQGGRYVSNRSFGAIKAIDNVGRISDAITVFGGSNAGVSSVSVYTGEATTTTERFAIDASGRVLMPYQPGCSVWYSGTDVTSGTIIYNNEEFNTGSHYNSTNGRFTAPVAGKYLVLINHLSNATSSLGVRLYKNGSPYTAYWAYNDSTTTNKPVNFSVAVSLAASDYLTVVRASGTVLGQANYHNAFTVYLLG